jgi:hypothetical protein
MAAQRVSNRSPVDLHSTYPKLRGNGVLLGPEVDLIPMPQFLLFVYSSSAPTRPLPLGRSDITCRLPMNTLSS